MPSHCPSSITSCLHNLPGNMSKFVKMPLILSKPPIVIEKCQVDVFWPSNLGVNMGFSLVQVIGRTLQLPSNTP